MLAIRPFQSTLTILSLAVLMTGSTFCLRATPSRPPFWNGLSDQTHFEKALNGELSKAKESLDQLLAVTGKRTVQNTLTPYDDIYLHLWAASAQALLVAETHPNELFRKAGRRIRQKAERFEYQLSVNREAYEAVKAVDLTEADAQTRYHAAKIIRDWQRNGIDKDHSTRRKVLALQNQLTTIGQQFSRNINEDSRVIEVSEAELEGLPPDFVARYQKGSAGKISLPIDSVSSSSILLYAKNDSLRRRVYLEVINRGYPRNMPILNKMIAIRHEIANLLGFPTWADYDTSDKMVKTAKNVADFLETLAGASAQALQEEYQRLLELKRREFPDSLKIQDGEVSYWRRRLEQQEVGADLQQVRNYFPYERVKQGIMDLSGELFGVKFLRIKGADLWHPSVECWEILEGDELIGRFYLDMHPRPDKYTSSAYFAIRFGAAGRQLPEGALVGDLPGGIEGDPGLLEHEDVRTFFHEFGHLLHAMFAGKQRWVGLGTMGLEGDFAEAPSQMLEEWMWDVSSLKRFAKHYQNQESIPEQLVAQLKQADRFGRAMSVREQVTLAAVALAYHDRDPAKVDTDRIMKEMTERYEPFPFVEGSHYQCSFLHLKSHSASVYTYLWSQVIAKDMFSRFDRRNLLDAKPAREYRAKVLEPGGSMPAEKLVNDFLGRPFNTKAWEVWLNNRDEN